MKSNRAASVRPRVVKAEHPLQWLADELADEPSYVNKAWFGGRMLVVYERNRLVLMAQGEPWQGVLVCTFHEHHESLRAELPSLEQHPVLGKWLYLAESREMFERDAKQLVRWVKARDPRIGIPLSAKKKRAAKRVRFGDAL